MKKRYVFLGFLALGILAVSPSLNSFFYQDDFGLICISRYIGNPFYFFIQDHFPGSLYYRPLSMVLWWSSYKVFGLASFLHNMLNILLHVTNAFVFYLLLTELLGKRHLVPLFSSSLFLCHPVSISTSLWLSNRFDLLAMLFILLSIYFSIRFVTGYGRKYFVYSISSTFLGILSKEISYILPVVVTVVFLSFLDVNSKGRWTKKVILLLPYYLMAIFLYALRSCLLGTAQPYSHGEIIQTVWKGLLKWAFFFVESHSYHFDIWGVGQALKYFFIGWFVLFLIILVLSIRKRFSIPWHVFLLGLAILAMSAFVLAPVMSLLTLIPPGHAFSFPLLVQGRFYYVSLSGFLLIFASSFLLPFRFFRNERISQRYATLISVLIVLISLTYLLSSFSLSHRYRGWTGHHDRQLVELAKKAVLSSSSVSEESKIYFLNIPQTPHSFGGYADAMMKVVAPKNSSIIHCLFFTEKPPWYHFVLKKDMKKTKIEPLMNMKYKGKDFGPLVVGKVAYFYFTFPKGEEIVKDEKAVFFEFSPTEGRFLDITEKVRSGAKSIHFFNDRPDA